MFLIDFILPCRPKDPLKPRKRKRKRRTNYAATAGELLIPKPLKPVDAVEPGGVNGHPPTRRMWCREAEVWYAKPKDNSGTELQKRELLALEGTAQRLGVSPQEWTEQEEREFRWWRKKRGGSHSPQKTWLWNHGTINYSQPEHTSAIPRLLPTHVKGGEPQGAFIETSWMPELSQPTDDGPFIPPTPRNDPLPPH